jgi:hypothetical protein
MIIPSKKIQLIWAITQNEYIECLTIGKYFYSWTILYKTQPAKIYFKDFNDLHVRRFKPISPFGF